MVVTIHKEEIDLNLGSCAIAAVLFLITLSIESNAEDEKKDHCISVPKIQEHLVWCYHNEYFSASAERCTKKYDIAIKKYQQKLNRKFENNEKKFDSAQNKKYENSEVDLLEANQALRQLIEMGKKIRAELGKYSESLILPGNPPPEFIAKYNMNETFADVYCIQHNREELENSIANVEKRISELEITSKQSVSLHQDTSKLGHDVGALREGTEVIGMGRGKSGRKSDSLGQAMGFRRPGSGISENPRPLKRIK